MLVDECGLKISLQEGTTQEALTTYVGAVKFMASWLAAQDGAENKNTKALLDEYGDNVCSVMKGAFEGTG